MTGGSAPNPRRVAAGRRNALKRTGLTDTGRTRLRAAALAQQPWRFSTGPRTPEGKARAAENGRVRQKSERSIRQLKAELGEYRALASMMAASRRRLDEIKRSP